MREITIDDVWPRLTESSRKRLAAVTIRDVMLAVNAVLAESAVSRDEPQSDAVSRAPEQNTGEKPRTEEAWRSAAYGWREGVRILLKLAEEWNVPPGRIAEAKDAIRRRPELAEAKRTLAPHASAEGELAPAGGRSEAPDTYTFENRFLAQSCTICKGKRNWRLDGQLQAVCYTCGNPPLPLQDAGTEETP